MLTNPMDAATEAARLKRFFAPFSAALVGASEDLSKFGGRLTKSMLAFGYERPLYFVNPGRTEVFGQRCYSDVSALPETPEHVAVVVSAERTMAVLEECSARGTPFATVLSGGYAETGTEHGIALQRELTAFARRSGMRILGPNCNGFINFVEGFAITNTAAIRKGRRPAGNIAVVGHSGGLAQVNVMWRAQEAGLGISYQVSCGNEADLDAIEFARFMIEDAATDVVLMALEAVRSGERFIGLAEEAAQRGKPLVVLKFGRTGAGERAAASHTGAVTGADAVFDGAFRQFGAIRVSDCNELYEVAKMLRTRRRPAGRRAVAVTGSGGHAVLMAELGASVGLEWPELSADTTEALRKLVPAFAGVSNPIDLTSAQTGAPTLFTDALKHIAQDPGIDLLVPVLVVPKVSALDALVSLHETIEKPLAVLWTGFCPDDERFTAATLVERGVPTYRDALMCARAVRASIDYARFLERFARRPRRDALVHPAGIDRERARALLMDGARVLTERTTKMVLAAYGLPVTHERLAQTAAEAARIASEMQCAVALKIESPDIPHKTEAGAIRLDVSGARHVRAAFDEVIAAAREHRAEARIDGVLVQEMVGSGLEMMLGVTHDPVFGPVIAVGMGGIHVEILRDVTHRIAPISRADIEDMLGELNARRLLEGVRGAAPRDVAALADAIERLSWLAYDLREDIAELDVNPLMVMQQGAGVRVVDALIVRKAGP
jgi:acetate---CoA ligase (ADP-forming)